MLQLLNTALTPFHFHTIAYESYPFAYKSSAGKQYIVDPIYYIFPYNIIYWKVKKYFTII